MASAHETHRIAAAQETAPRTSQRGGVASIALVLHGKIGMWSIKSANVPQRGKQLKGTELLLAHAVSAAPKAPPVASNVSLWELERRPHSMLVGFARFASKSIWRRVIEPNRRAGLQTDVFLHSWHPEIGDELDRMYSPVRSRHESPRRIHKVASHHLSMKRGIELAMGHAAPSLGSFRTSTHAPHDLYLVARFDLIFYSDLLLAPLGDAPLWLPTWCMRYPIDGAQYRQLSVSCGGRHGGNAYVLTPPRVSVMHPRLQRSISREDDVDLVMLDWWFVAPPLIAATFGNIYDRFASYVHGLSTAHRGVPLESHYFWAYHVHHVLRLGGSVRYVADQVEGRDFRLARQWMFGPHCSHHLADEIVAPVFGNARRRAGRAARGAKPLAHHDSLLGGPHAAYLGLDLTHWQRTTVLNRPSEGGSGSTVNITFAQQCSFDARVKLFCPWTSPVCNASLKVAALDMEAEAKTAYAETTRIRPIPRLWLAPKQRQQFRAEGLTVGARREQAASRAGRAIGKGEQPPSHTT